MIEQLHKITLYSDSCVAVSWGSWQQCIDENTQHPYFWNTSTNEVTWTVPEEIAIQYQQITGERTGKDHDPDKKENKFSLLSNDKTSNEEKKRTFVKCIYAFYSLSYNIFVLYMMQQHNCNFNLLLGIWMCRGWWPDLLKSALHYFW